MDDLKFLAPFWPFSNDTVFSGCQQPGGGCKSFYILRPKHKKVFAEFFSEEKQVYLFFFSQFYRTHMETQISRSVVWSCSNNSFTQHVSRDVFFSVLRCVSWHISTPVYQSFYHLTTAMSPFERKQEAPKRTQTPAGVSGGWRGGRRANDLTRYRICFRLYRLTISMCFA